MKRVLIIFCVSISILILSCAEPSEPVISENDLEIDMLIETGRYATDIDVSEDYLYIVEDEAAFSIYSLADNEQLCYLDSIDDGSSVAYFDDLQLITASQTGEKLFVYDRSANPASIFIYDIATPDNPNYIFPIRGNTTSVDGMYADYDGTKTNLYWANDYLLGCGYYDGLWNPVDTFNDDNVLSYNGNEYFNAIAKQDTVIIAANDQAGIKIIHENFSSVISTFDVIGEANDVEIKGNYAYVALRQEGFAVINIEDFENPELEKTVNFGELIYSIDIEDDLMVLSSHAGGILLYGISEPDNPIFIGQISSDEIGYTFDAMIKNNKIYAATRRGVYIINIK